MTVRRKYSLPQAIKSEISDTVDLVSNNIGTLNYKIVPLSAIELDPDNPRDLAITRQDIPQGPRASDPLHEKKMQEFGSLNELAETIKKYGVRNAVEIYKFGNTYRLIHGERRFLSSLLAGKKEIPAKILDEKPSNFDIRMLQFIENAQRKNLSLYETLTNIKQLIKEYRKHVNPTVVVNSVFLEGLINRSKTHSLNVLSVLNGPENLNAAIRAGKINNLEKASIVAKAKSDEHRERLMKFCLASASLKALKREVIRHKKMERISGEITIISGKKRPGKKASQINLGTTKNKAVVAKIVQLVSMDPFYRRFKKQFDQMSFKDFGSCSNAITALIQLMEKIEVN